MHQRRLIGAELGFGPVKPQDGLGLTSVIAWRRSGWLVTAVADHPA
jgi:hypothetical protein